MSMNEETKQTKIEKSGGHNRVVSYSVLAVFGMFAFGFALVPLYDVFCDITGLNGKTGDRYEGQIAEANKDRTVRVQFITSNNAGMPWDFRPVIHEVVVSPGEMKKVEFYAKNPTASVMTAQAVPSVSPSKGAQYFHKTECFCFESQELKSGEDINMGLLFVLDTELPEDIQTLTLSYTLFDITERTTKTKS